MPHLSHQSQLVSCPFERFGFDYTKRPVQQGKQLPWSVDTSNFFLKERLERVPHSWMTITLNQRA